MSLRANQLNGDLPLYNAISEFIQSENKDIHIKLNEIKSETLKNNEDIVGLTMSINRACDLLDKHFPTMAKLIALFMLIVGGANIVSIFIQLTK